MTVAARPLGGRRLFGSRVTRTQRRWIVAAAVVVTMALVVAVVAALGAHRARSDTATSGDRTEILTAAGQAVTALMNFGPSEPTGHWREVLGHLTDPLALDFRTRGPDVVLPGALSSGVTMTAQVVGVGLHGSSGESAEVLVFVDEGVSTGVPVDGTGSKKTGTAPIARWAIMRKVDGNWLLADLRPVGDITR